MEIKISYDCMIHLIQIRSCNVMYLVHIELHYGIYSMDKSHYRKFNNKYQWGCLYIYTCMIIVCMNGGARSLLQNLIINISGVAYIYIHLHDHCVHEWRGQVFATCMTSAWIIL